MTFPEKLAVTVWLDGIDVTNYVDPKAGIAINNMLSRRADTCKLILERASAITLSTWKELVVTKGYRTNAEAGGLLENGDGLIFENGNGVIFDYGERLFAGYVTEIDEEESADLDIDFSVRASDYSIRLEKVVVKEEYDGWTDKEIIADLFESYLPDENFDSVTYVTEIKTHSRIRFNRKSLLDVLKQLANFANAEFYIDYNKRLHFFEKSTGETSAPFAFSDNPNGSTLISYYDLEVNRDGSDVVNRVEVIGGNYRSLDATFYLPGTGTEKRALLPFKLHAPDGETGILVYRNDGTFDEPSWTQLSVKVGYIDALSDDNEILYYYAEKVLEARNNLPNLPNALKIIAKYEVPLRTRVVDAASQEHFGMIFDDVLTDDTITDKNIAKVAGTSRLLESAEQKTAISLKTLQPGLRAGMVIPFTNTIHALNAEYLIQKVTTKIFIDGKTTHTIDLGTYNADLIDFILTVNRNAKPRVGWRDDEVLDEVYQWSDSLSLSETSDQSTSTGPYYFSDDPEVAFVWGFGAFQP